MRRTLLRRLVLRRFGKDNKAAAAVEFALILPFLLLLFLGSIEASSLITVDRRVNVVSGTVGDLVSRSIGSINLATLTDYFRASEGIIFPYATSALKQRVSLVQVTSGGVATVVWSCGYNGQAARTAGDPYTLPANTNVIARPPSGSGYVVASESFYSYLPVFGIVFQNVFNLYRESFYLPRQEALIAGPASC